MLYVEFASGVFELCLSYLGLKETPSQEDWLINVLPENSKVGVDPWIIAAGRLCSGVTLLRTRDTVTIKKMTTYKLIYRVLDLSYSVHADLGYYKLDPALLPGLITERTCSHCTFIGKEFRQVQPCCDNACQFCYRLSSRCQSIVLFLPTLSSYIRSVEEYVQGADWSRPLPGGSAG